MAKNHLTVPLHFREAVKAQLEGDVWIGVLMKVPPNTPLNMDMDLVTHVLNTCTYISACGKGGITMSFNKQQLFLWKVHFSGRIIGESEIYPDPKLLQSIAEFPQPCNISRVQVFFGLVEQVSFYFSKRDTMDPFCYLLKSKLLFLWT